MDTGRELYLQVVFDENGAINKVTNLGHAIKGVGGESEQTSGKINKLTESFSRNTNSVESFINTLKSLGIAYAALRIERMIEGWVKLDIQQSQANQSLRAAMITNERFTESFYRSTIKQAEALQRLTGIGDETIMRGQKMLMMFDAISNDQMPRATRAMLNLSAVMDGDARSAAIALGKAMEGQTEGLRRAGIIIDADVYKLRGAVGVLEEVEKKVEGQAEALAQGSGKWKILGANIGDVKEGLGKFFTLIADKSGVLEFATKLTGNLADAMANLTRETQEYQRVKDKPLIEMPAVDTNIPWQGSTPQSFIKLQVKDLADLRKEIERLKAMGAEIQFAPGAEESLTKLTDFMHDLAATPYKQKVEELDKFFNELPESLRKSEAAQNAYQRALDVVKEKFQSAKDKAKDLTDQVHELRAEWGSIQWGQITPQGRDFFNRGWFGQPKEYGMKNLTLGNFSTALTPRQSDEQFYAEVEKQIKMEMDAYDKAQEKIKKKQDEAADKIKRQQEEIAQRWDRISSQMGSSLTEALVDSTHDGLSVFENFGKQAGDIFLREWMDKLITQPLIMPIINSLSGLFGYGNTGAGGTSSALGGAGQWQSWLLGSSMGPIGTPASESYRPSPIGMAGAGIIGYQYGGVYGTMGSLGGYAFGGPIGAVIGGAIGSWLNDAAREKPKIKSFDLLWEVIDGQVKNVADTWQNMTRDPEVFNAAQVFVQSTTGFFRRLSTVTGNAILEMPDWRFSLQAVGEDVKAVLNQQTTQATIRAIFGEYGNLSEIFGPDFQQQVQQLFLDTMSPSLTQFVYGRARQLQEQYLQWKLTQFLSMEPGQAMASFDAWMNSQDIFSPIGRDKGTTVFELFQKYHPEINLDDPHIFEHLENFANTINPGWFNRGEIAFAAPESQAMWKNFFLGLDQQITAIFDLVKAGMGDAFSASLHTGQFQVFEDRFKQSILRSVQQGLIEGFANQELVPIIFEPFYGKEGRPAITDVLKQYQAGDIDLTQAQGYLSTMFTELTDTLKEFEPVWGLLNTAFQGLTQALGLNTTAVEGNTSAVLGPVNQFLMSLDTGPLAPVRSTAALAGLGNKLYTAAFADAGEFSDYANFMTSSWLPHMMSTSQDYSSVVAGIRAEVEAIPWVAQAQGKAPTASDIGAEVAKAVAPMLLDLKEAGQITINVVVDGHVIKSQVVNSLEDPAVVQRLRERV